GVQPRSMIPFARSVVLAAKLYLKIAFVAVVDNRLHISCGLLTKIDRLPRLGKSRRRIYCRVVLTKYENRVATGRIPARWRCIAAIRKDPSGCRGTSQNEQKTKARVFHKLITIRF